MRTIRIDLSGRILDAIGWAKQQDREIVSINIPKLDRDHLKEELLSHTKPKTDQQIAGLEIKEIYGIKVKKSDKLSITVKI